jgi:hypothetical protein
MSETLDYADEVEREQRARFDIPLPLLATIKRTAWELQVSPRTVYDMVGRGDLEMVHVGPRGARITRESILRVAAKRSAPKPIQHFAKSK